MELGSNNFFFYFKEPYKESYYWFGEIDFI